MSLLGDQLRAAGASEAAVTEFEKLTPSVQAQQFPALLSAATGGSFPSRAPYPAPTAAPAGTTAPAAPIPPNIQHGLDLGLIQATYDSVSGEPNGYALSPYAQLLPQSEINRLLGVTPTGGTGADQSLGIGGLTGYYGGQPTLERQAFQAQQDLAQRQFIAGLSQQAYQRPLDQAGITGYYGGNPTFARQQWMGQLGLSQGDLTGYYNGQPTFARQQADQNASQFWQQLAQQNAQFGQDFGLRQQTADWQNQLGIGGLTGYYNGQPTLDRTLGMGNLGVAQGQLGLNAMEFNRRLTVEPVNFIAAQLAARGPGTTVGDLRYPGAVGGLLFGGGVQEAGPAATPGDVRIPSLQMLNQATGDELAAVGAGYQYLTQQPESLLWNQAQRLGLSSYG